MNISDQYHYKDFTHLEYKKVLIDAKNYYQFVNYSNYKNCQNNYIILRHDVDFSVHRSLKIAKIEAELGIQSTYFILLHSEFYNVFDKEIKQIIDEIILLGHHIGLHFDSHFYGINDENKLDQYLYFEKNILETLFNVKINVFSFHNTNEFVLSCKKDKYADLINTYSHFFQDKNQIAYCSDSFGIWRYERLCEIIKEKKYNKLQILTHPGWWTETNKSPSERMEEMIIQRKINTIFKFNQFIQKYNLPDIYKIDQ